MRVLVASPHHPEIVAGGAERAAYSLFQRLREDRRVEAASFVAGAASSAIGHSANFGSFRGTPDEVLAALPPVDGFTLETRDYNELSRRIRELVRHFKPDLVHLHHVLEWGVEAIEIFSRVGVPVVFTLHEFILMCHQNGQMLKTSGALCHAASPAECSECFPDFSAGKFFIRARVLRHLLGQAGALVSPSHFLKTRFVDWGVPADRITVIENLFGAEGASTKALQKAGRRRLVFGFFGQITPFKGVDVLLQAFALLPEKVREKIELRIYGANRYWRGGEFERRFEALVRKAAGVRMLGAYRNEDAIALMRACDYVVVPSIWWENSPVVIQEAKLAGVRIISSDIGGMAEKTDHPEFDILFPAGSAAALAGVMEELSARKTAGERALPWQDRPAAVLTSQRAALDAHIALYESAVEAAKARHRSGSRQPAATARTAPVSHRRASRTRLAQ